MRDLSTLAKLLAEEDINVVHKKQQSASFDVLNRELSLPIWKEMSKDIQDLMTIHEVGHALWTPVEMLDEVNEKDIDFSIVNVLEDVRIEKNVQSKYLGSVNIFKRGYQELISKDFFGTNGQDVSKLNLIDRINLHYKHHSNIPFTNDEMIWVEKADKTVTPDDVIELAKELHDYMLNNAESQGQDPNGSEIDLNDNISAMMGPMMSSPQQSDQEEDSDDNMDGSGKSEEADGDESETPSDSGSGSSDNSSEETEENISSGNSAEESDGDSESQENVAENMSEGGRSNGEKSITSITDKNSNNNFKDMLDRTANQRQYAFVPKINLKEAIVDYKTIMDHYRKHYNHQVKIYGDEWKNIILSELDKFTKDNKKTVAYMVKEFEMKKAADQYARASSSKTGSLDMGKLHTYKFNDDLFQKVTTLPGATNHGLVLLLDWSGSMASNLQGTLNQLYNLIWFCKRTQIPFEVLAFSDVYRDGKQSKMTNFKSGDLVLKNCTMLQFFSSKMNNKDTYQMMYNLNAYASMWDYSLGNKTYRYDHCHCLKLGGTPLGECVAFALDFIPAFQKETGVQKINTVFLTDGYGCRLDSVHHVYTDEQVHNVGYDRSLGAPLPSEINDGTKYLQYSNDIIVKDNVTNKSVNSKDFGRDTTKMLLSLLKSRVPDMNIVNFFVAGNHRGKVNKYTVSPFVSKPKGNCDYFTFNSRVAAITKKINKEKVGIFNNVDGFDQLYLLCGLKYDTDDEVLDVESGASKAKLKRAFGKMATQKQLNRPLLNNFVKMVA